MRKLVSVLLTVAVAVSLCLVTAVPTAAQESISITGDVNATITRTDTLDTVTFNIEILSENVPHSVYGVGMAFATSIDKPSFQVWYAEAGNIPAGYTDYGWYYQEYGTGWNGEVTPLADKTGFSATGERTQKTFSLSVPTAELGGFGATYYYAVQVRTNLINSYPDGWSWGSSVSEYASATCMSPNTAVGLTVETSNITAISVEPGSIAFGRVNPGDVVSGDNITVTNIGGVTVRVDADLDPLNGTVFNYLQLSGAYSSGYSGSWTPIISSLLPNRDRVLTTQLVVPETYSGKGVETATLVFTATAA